MFKKKANYFKTKRDWLMILAGFLFGAVLTYLLLWQTIAYISEILVLTS